MSCAMAEWAMPLANNANAAPTKTCLARIPTSSLKKLTQTVFALDLRNRQPADARQRTAAVGDGDRDHDLVGARRVVDLDFHPVEMAAHKRRILVAEGNIERRAGAASLLRRRDQRRALAQYFPHRRTHFGVKNRGRMFQLAVLADRRSLAIALRLGTVDTECCHGPLRQKFAQL